MPQLLCHSACSVHEWYEPDELPLIKNTRGWLEVLKTLIVDRIVFPRLRVIGLSTHGLTMFAKSRNLVLFVMLTTAETCFARGLLTSKLHHYSNTEHESILIMGKMSVSRHHFLNGYKKCLLRVNKWWQDPAEILPNYIPSILLTLFLEKAEIIVGLCVSGICAFQCCINGGVQIYNWGVQKTPTPPSG